MRFRPLRKRHHIRAVHDGDLETLLASLGILGEVNRGEIRCVVCGQQVTLQNLGAVLPTEGRIGLSCESRSCLEKALPSESGRD
jgi:hypothetical protein